VEHALLGGLLRPRSYLLALGLADETYADLDEVAHNRVHVPADVADLGELGRLDLEERRAGQSSQPAGDFSLADACRPDHQNVLGQHLLAQLRSKLLSAPAIAEGNRDRALGIVLADYEAVEL